MTCRAEVLETRAEVEGTLTVWSPPGEGGQEASGAVSLANLVHVPGRYNHCSQRLNTSSCILQNARPGKSGGHLVFTNGQTEGK